MAAGQRSVCQCRRRSVEETIRRRARCAQFLPLAHSDRESALANETYEMHSNSPGTHFMNYGSLEHDAKNDRSDLAKFISTEERVRKDSGGSLRSLCRFPFILSTESLRSPLHSPPESPRRWYSRAFVC